MFKPATNPELINELKKVAGQPMSESEIRAQKVSFIMGAVDKKSKITRKRIVEVIDASSGRHTS